VTASASRATADPDRPESASARSVILVLVLLTLLVSSCGFLGSGAAEFELKAAADRLSEAGTEYDRLSTESTIADLSRQAELLAASIGAVEELEAAYREWDDALTSALAADAVPEDQVEGLVEYREALGPWVDAQAEQIDVLLPCFSEDLTSFDERCWLERASEGLPRWQRLSEELYEVERRISAELQSG
jgi:oligoendopeptidase F